MLVDSSALFLKRKCMRKSSQNNIKTIVIILILFLLGKKSFLKSEPKQSTVSTGDLDLIGTDTGLDWNGNDVENLLKGGQGKPINEGIAPIKPLPAEILVDDIPGLINAPDLIQTPTKIPELIYVNNEAFERYTDKDLSDTIAKTSKIKEMPQTDSSAELAQLQSGRTSARTSSRGGGGVSTINETDIQTRLNRPDTHTLRIEQTL